MKKGMEENEFSPCFFLFSQDALASGRAAKPPDPEKRMCPLLLLQWKAD